MIRLRIFGLILLTFFLGCAKKLCGAIFTENVKEILISNILTE